jgi:Cu/Zn superoxide dismutase
MSLYDAEKSILGRSVVVHENEDTGEQPYGQAGSPIAAGVIGLFNPAADADTTEDTNGAVAPTSPSVTAVMCYLHGDFEGPVLLERGLLDTQADMTVVLQPAAAATEAVTHSFHFHVYANKDMHGVVWQSDYLEVSAADCEEGGRAWERRQRGGREVQCGR